MIWNPAVQQPVITVHILAGDCFYLLRLADCIQVFSAFIRSSTVLVSLQGTDPATRSHFNLAFWRSLLLKPAVFFPLYKQQPPRRMPKSMKPGNMKWNIIYDILVIHMKLSRRIVFKGRSTSASSLRSHVALEFYHVFFVSMVELRQVVFAAYDHADTKLQSLTIILKIDQNVARWLNV